MPCTNGLIVLGLLLALALVGWGLARLAARFFGPRLGRIATIIVVLALGGVVLVMSPVIYVTLLFSFDGGSSFCQSDLFAPPK